MKSRATDHLGRMPPNLIDTDNTPEDIELEVFLK
jgi:hypothetical protein